MAKKQILTYKFVPGNSTPTTSLYPNARFLINANKKFIQEEAIAYVQNNVANNIQPYTSYVYDANLLRTEISNTLDGFTNDLRHGANTLTVFNANQYWKYGVELVVASPLAATYSYISNMIRNYILTNTDFNNLQTTVSQVINNAYVSETASYSAFSALSLIITNSILSGTSTIPAIINDRGYIKLSGNYHQNDMLIITNTTRNTILYNFADPSSPTEITYTDTYDSDFPGALYGNDKVSTVWLDYDTSNMLLSDDIQVFVEVENLPVRLNPIATDAMERMKVGIPQSMLDADFEYGLQPTKWQTIGLMRNYPSIYEIPNSDQTVINVTTDASSGNTGNAGASLITVTTQNSHGFSVNQPFTIKALAVSVSGFNRAEGSFLVNSIPSANTFTYYAKSKVGTNSGDIISTNYTQLRTGAFYTGAAVGTPQFSVYSNGSSGTITTSLITPTGSNTIAFTGTPPLVGAPLSGTGIATGTQITSVSGSGSTVATTSLSVTANIGDSSITVNSATGIGTGLAINRGDGRAAIVTNVVGNTLTLSTALTSTILGSSQSFPSQTPTIISGSGVGAVFDIARVSDTVYSASIVSAGTGYKTNDVLKVLGTNLGGSSPANDATITVLTASNRNSVASLDLNTINPGQGYYYNTYNTVAYTGSGSGLTVQVTDLIVTFNDGNGNVQYGIKNLSIVNPGSGYAIGDYIQIGIDTDFHGGQVTIATVSAGGLIQSVSVAGTPISIGLVSFISAFTINTPTTSQIASGNTGITYSAIPTIQISFQPAHGFIPGDTITVQITSSDTNAQLAAGAFFVEQVPSPTTILYTARAAGTIANTLTGFVYGRPDSYFIHRPFDGGVQLGTGGPAHGATAIRMSKKYIRYQSGKGVMYNTGALFAPSYNIASITSTGTAIGSIITVTMDDVDHGCQVGGSIDLSGVNTSGYNGNYIVFSIITERVLTIIAKQVLGNTSALIGNPCVLSVRNWHGATVRAGIFDDQNGMFWQYDGIRLSVVKRSSTFQIAGSIALATNSNQVFGTGTRFTQQLATGDRIVIRGMTHVVSLITSDTNMSITPDYRGTVDLTSAKVAKTNDLIVPQEYFNRDTLNGKGDSGYNVDITKMQMIGIQHTWYGAGFIDFMLRGSDGNYVFAHRFRNSNYNTEAYMRSGNQPVRYEVINEGAKDKLSAAITASDTVLPLTNTYFFPPAGTVCIDSELISYTANNGTALVGCTRGTTLTQFAAGSNRTFSGSVASSHAFNSGVILVSNTITPIISHWGSAYMIDGQFDSDRGYIFNYAATGVNASTSTNTAFLIRLAPSVSNAQTGDLGVRELLNRAQMLLSNISITSDSVSGGGAIVVQGILNPINYPSDPTLITWTGLNSLGAGGQPSFAQIASGGSVSWGGGASTANATVQGAFTSSITAVSFASATTNLTAVSFSPVQQTVSAVSFNIFSTGSATSFGIQQSVTAPAVTLIQNSTYQFAFQNTRNDFLFPQSVYAAFTTPIAVGDVISVPTYVTGAQTIASITPNYITINSVTYVRIVMSANANASSATNTAVSSILITNPTGAIYNSALSTGRNDFLIPQTTFAAFSPAVVVGDRLFATTYITAGQTINSINQNYVTLAGVAYCQIVMSAIANSTSTANTLNSVGAQNITVTFTNASSFTYNNAFSSSRSDFLITNTAYAALTTTLAVGDIVSASSYVGGGQTISSITSSYVTFNSIPYTRIVMSANATSTSPAAATTNAQNISTTITNALSNTYNTAVSQSRTDFLITQTQYAGISIAVTDALTNATYINTAHSISSITPNFVTISGTVYARIVMSSPANTTSTGGTGNNITIVATSSSTATYGSALNSTRSDFLITDAQYATSGISTSDILSLNTFITGSQTISTITQSFVTINSVSYTRIVMSAVANSTSTSGAGQNQTITVTAAGSAATYVSTNYLFFTSSSWLTSSATLGTKLAVSYTQFPAGTSVAAVSSRTFNSAISTVTNAASSGGGSTVTYTLTGSSIYPVGSTVTVSGITGGTAMNGTFVVTSSVAGTLIVTSTGSGTPSSYSGASVVGATVYRATFTQTANTTISAGATPTFQFGAAYALPGEQVFSFVNNPGNTDQLDLSGLKEMTSTAIGGRGTFPNGPDVLAINVYKVSGSATPVNVILRWSEAQA